MEIPQSKNPPRKADVKLANVLKGLSRKEAREKLLELTRNPNEDIQIPARIKGTGYMRRGVKNKNRILKLCSLTPNVQ